MLLHCSLLIFLLVHQRPLDQQIIKRLKIHIGIALALRILKYEISKYLQILGNDVFTLRDEQRQAPQQVESVICTVFGECFVNLSNVYGKLVEYVEDPLV